MPDAVSLHIVRGPQLLEPAAVHVNKPQPPMVNARAADERDPGSIRTDNGVIGEGKRLTGAGESRPGCAANDRPNPLPLSAHEPDAAVPTTDDENALRHRGRYRSARRWIGVRRGRL